MYVLPPLSFPGPMCALYSRSWGPRKSTSAHAGTGIKNPSVAKRRKLSIAFHSDPLCFSGVSAHGLIRGQGSPGPAPVALKVTVGHISDGLVMFCISNDSRQLDFCLNKLVQSINTP